MTGKMCVRGCASAPGWSPHTIPKSRRDAGSSAKKTLPAPRCSSYEHPAGGLRLAGLDPFVVFRGKVLAVLTWKDYADQNRIREMTLPGEEFLRRFLLHVLPERFVRIRYFGLLANRHRQEALARCRKALPGSSLRPKAGKMDWRELYQKLTGLDPSQCEVCGQKALRLAQELSPVRRRERPPPCA